MQLNCPNCTKPVISEGINIIQTIAKCANCNEIFDFTDELIHADFPMPYRQEIVIPPGIELLKMMDQLEIMIKWRKSAKMFMPFFALFWNVFIGLFFIIGFFAGEIMMLLFSIPFMLVGVYLIYASIGYLLNTTYVTIDEHRVSIEHKPINFLIQRDRHIPSKDIDQVFVSRYEVGKQNKEPVYAFAVELLLNNRKQQRLVEGLHSAEYGRYIEQEIERFLKILDRKVKGEWEKPSF